VDTPGRVPIVEVMRFNPSVRKYVSENADEKLYSVIFEREDGMQAFNHSLKHFVDLEYISRAAAFEISPNPEQLKMWLKGITTKAS
jgi:twitching motility protein PilT